MLGEDKAEIFEAHIMLLEDEDLQQEITKQITEQLV
ncbi:Phosphoenolpyruvate-protein kinase, partial [Candidatus Regiella insecticola 5.15]